MHNNFEYNFHLLLFVVGYGFVGSIEMKMSDYFLGDVYASGRNLGDDRCDEFMLAEFEDSAECAAAAHAINNYDSLVEENEKLTAIIERIIENNSTKDGGQFAHYWSEKLKEAKS